MSAERYPLCEKAGLSVRNGNISCVEFRPSGAMTHERSRVDYISAADLEAWLAGAPVVYAHAGPSTKGLDSPVWIAKGWHDADSTHQARLLCIEPLVRESEERQLLREYFSRFINGEPDHGFSEWLERARKLLKREGK